MGTPVEWNWFSGYSAPRADATANVTLRQAQGRLCGFAACEYWQSWEWGLICVRRRVVAATGPVDVGRRSPTPPKQGGMGHPRDGPPAKIPTLGQNKAERGAQSYLRHQPALPVALKVVFNGQIAPAYCGFGHRVCKSQVPAPAKRQTEARSRAGARPLTQNRQRWR